MVGGIGFPTRLVAMAETYFDQWIARHYAELWPELFDPLVLDPTVDFLADLAGDGAALEFGIGTGRVAIPLNSRGFVVNGIELSSAMVEELEENGGRDVTTVVGDFAASCPRRAVDQAEGLRERIRVLRRLQLGSMIFSVIAPTETS
jgi:hypothetical protein